MAQVNLTQGAKLAGVHRSTLGRHIKDGKITAIEGEDGKLRVETSELEQVYGTMSDDASKDGAPEGVAHADDAVHTPVHAAGAVHSDASKDGAPEDVARADDGVHAPVHADVAVRSVASESSASATPDHAMHRPIEKVNTWVNPSAHEVNALEIEARMLREHVTRLEADRERDCAQLAELIATLRAPVRSVAPEDAARAEDTVPGPSRSETPDPEEWTAADLKQLMEETRDTVRAGRVILGRIEEKLIARPGLLIRALVALPVAWCVASGVFVVGILATYGPGQFLQLGHTVFSALRNTYWPF